MHALQIASSAGAREAWTRPAPDGREGPVRSALTDRDTVVAGATPFLVQ